MLNAFRRNWVQIALVATIFLVFVANSTGSFELAVGLRPGSSTIRAALRSPEFITLLIIGAVLSFGLPVLSPIKASMLTFAATLPVFYLGYRIHMTRPLIPMEYQLLTILMLFIVNVMASYFSETHRKQRLVEAFGHYVPPEIARKIGENPERLGMHGESRELTVMFADVHNFTAISEQFEPRELARLLHALFTPLSRIIYKHHGLIDKYMGDAVMAFWGAPLDDPHHAANAIAAAFEMQEEMERLGVQFRAHGWPEMRVGIGLNSGVASVGNMGSDYRVAYTALGDAVNLASRLQELTRVYHADVVVGEATRRAFPSVAYRELGLVKVKGKERLVRIYEPCNPSLDPESTIVMSLNRHNEALRSYYARQWEAAEELFRELKKARPADPLYDYYLARISEFKVAPPPEGWQGEIRYKVG